MPFKVPKKQLNPEKENEIKSKEITISSCYQVVYSRDVRKKHKKMFDGILVSDGNNIKLYDSNSKQIYSGKYELRPDETEIFIGPFYIEVLSIAQFEDFKSGKIFLVQQQDPVKIVQKPKPFKLAQQQIVQSKEKHQLDEQYYIDQFLYIKLRPHQIEGIKFMLECVTSKRNPQISGCILADSMGLGKTLQAITLMWMLMKQTIIQKIVIICPVTLVKNWENEIFKWLGQMRVQPLLGIGSKEEVHKQVEYFLHSPYNCMITSYETFRNISDKIDKIIDLMIFDEGHRLKNNNIKTVQTLSSLKCKRRVILTGTPIQNCMKEFYACCDFVNPGIFKCYKTFKTVFEDPIKQSMEKESNVEVKELGKLRSLELAQITSQFILRRKPEILSKFLPTKFEYLLFCQLSKLQRKLYKENVLKCSDQIMVQLTNLRKITTHPDLMDVRCESSTKIDCLKVILHSMKENEKIVINSYYSQTLDLIENHIILWKFEFVRLDGKVPNQKRQNIVDQFNTTQSITIFLLNGKSGGTGLNLIGANKLICMEVDWNPANDAQVMARIWRDGQTKHSHIYRLIASGTYEEKILQRQLSKHVLSQKIVDETSIQQEYSSDELKELLKFNEDFKCQLYTQSDNIDNECDYPIELNEMISLVKIQKVQGKLENEFEKTNVFIDLEEFPLFNLQPEDLSFLD